MDSIITNKGIVLQSELNSLFFNSDDSVYEVFRIINGVALFLEDHFERLKSSVEISGLLLNMDLIEFSQYVNKLLRLNNRIIGNVKFILFGIENEIEWAFSFIPHSYPESIDYLEGVSTGLLYAERENPNAKIIQSRIRDIASQMIADLVVYEVLLVDRNGIITEGSRSNVFFVKDGRFYTASGPQVLVGITRQKVLNCLAELGYKYIEEAVAVSEIKNFDAVFLTGTSPKVLPVNCIGTHQYKTNNFFVEQLRMKYDSMIVQYINKRKKGKVN